MLGKLFGLLAVVMVIIAFTGINVVPIYEKFTNVRNQLTPSFDHLVEKGLKIAANTNIKERVQPYIDNATSGNST